MSVHRRGETGWASSDGTCAVVGTTFLLVGLSAACAYVLTGASIPGRIDAGAQPDMDGCAAGAIVQPPADDRAYRYLELPNGMQAVVVHDPDGDMAAASIDVHTGSLSNPPELPGLAHFLEHMLFTGNEKYAGNSDYFKFITTHGGMANAATDLEVTNFHLKIPPAQIEAALDRLFQFFVSPTLKQDMTSREMHAVSSEHAKNVLQDDWRFLRLQRITTGNPNCPLRHFMTGNLDTLANATSEDLRRFWTREYTPNRFAIAVVSPHPLDVLERWVRELGAAIPARAPEPYAEFGDAPGPVPPEPSAGLEAGGVDAHGVAVGGRLIEYVPVADFDVLHLMWYLPPYERAGGGPEQEYSKKSFSYITRLLGDEGPGSVVSLLRTQRGWISSLTVYAAHPASFFSRVDVAILLTEAGLSHVDEVVQAVFAYLELLRGSEPERRRWEESKRLSDISWRFADKPAALGLAHSLSSTLGERVVPVCDALRAPYVHRTFDPDQIRAVLARLTPDTLLMYVGSKRFGEEAAADEEPPPPPELQPPPMQTERYYGVRYRVRALTAEQRELWTAGAREPSLRAQLALPPRNRFIPTEFALVGAPSAGGARDRCERVAPTPRLLGGSAGARLWSHVDRTFEQPKASVICTISAPAISADAERLWTTQLLMELTSDTLNEETYPATMAGLAAGASADIEGLQLSVGGYSGKVLDLLALAARTLSAGDSLSEARFGPIKALMLSDLRAAQYAGALDTALNKLKLILRTQTASYDRLGGVPVVEAATLDGVKAHARSLFAEGAFSECLVNGNLREEDAREAERTLRAAMGDPPPLAAPALAALRQRVYSVPVGWTVHASAALDPDETNSVAVLYYEVGPTELDLKVEATLELLVLMSQEAMFSSLRTDEQLGYTVGMNTYRAWSAQAVVMYARSTVVASDYLDERIEAFVRAHAEELRAMSAEEFGVVKRALQDNLRVHDSNLGEQTERMWSEIEMHDCRFGRTLELRRAVRELTLDDVMELYERVLLDPASRRKMSVWVRAPGEGTRPAPRRKAGTEPLEGADVLDDAGLDAWRAARELLPAPTACNDPPPPPPCEDDEGAGADDGAAAPSDEAGRNATLLPDGSSSGDDAESSLTTPPPPSAAPAPAA